MNTEIARCRAEILKARDRLSNHDRHEYSTRICSTVNSLPEIKSDSTVLAYISFRSEVETHQLIRDWTASGMIVAVPRTDTADHRLETYILKDWNRDLTPGAYGILEPDPKKTLPIPPSRIDAVLVPGSVFDLKCGRYGYGGGFYDRFLSEAAPQAVRIGLAYSLQLLPEIALQPHDQKMDIIVTESDSVRCMKH